LSKSFEGVEADAFSGVKDFTLGAGEPATAGAGEDIAAVPSSETRFLFGGIGKTGLPTESSLITY
jgi:hypothetical protein